EFHRQIVEPLGAGLAVALFGIEHAFDEPVADRASDGGEALGVRQIRVRRTNRVFRMIQDRLAETGGRCGSNGSFAVFGEHGTSFRWTMVRFGVSLLGPMGCRQEKAMKAKAVRSEWGRMGGRKQSGRGPRSPPERSQKTHIAWLDIS